MPIRVYDYRTDIANVVVRPEIRARFLRSEPGPAGLMHSHDLGGELFLVLEGQCEFLVEDERVTCGPGQLIYVEPRQKHTLHAVGGAPCLVYLSVTPHVEPTHTLYDEAYTEQPPRYGTWRGQEQGDPYPEVATAGLAELAHANASRLEDHVQAVNRAVAVGDQPAVKRAMDEMWRDLRAVLEQVSATERTWNALAPRAMLAP